MDKIGPYRILETIHRGPQPLFKVAAADGTFLAVKAIPVAGLTAESRERFTREAETCRNLQHPNVIRVYEMGEADGMLYQAMELLVGRDLGKVMAEGRQFSWEAKLAIMEQVCDGLQYAHERNLVHRDIKPANLFLEDAGRMRVLDFGMVRVAESELTKAGSSLGTLNYMSPEQIRGERCTAASDVFSAGIVFFQLAAGRHPFSARDRSLAQVVSAIVFEQHPKLTELCPDAPEGLEFILNRALEKDAVRRPKNAGELKQALSLCRMTLKMGVAPAPAASAVPQSAAGASQVDNEKTKVMPKATASVVVDDEKTQVMKRVTPPSQIQPSPLLTAPPKSKPVTVTNMPKPSTVTGMPALQFRYCPTCTAQNGLDAVVCRKCGNPLSGSAAAKSREIPWALYTAIAVAVVLAIALVLVLVFKK